MTNPINVSRALSKSVSLLDEAKANSSNITFGYVAAGKNTLNGKTVSDEEAKIKKAYKSVTDKIDESFRMRQGINKINSTTEIVIGNKRMTIADALAYKLYIIPARQALLNKLEQDRKVTVAEYRKAKAAYDAELNALESKNADGDMAALIAHKQSVEPKVYAFDAEIECIRNEVEFFVSEFDAIMSELNPTLKFDV